MCIPLPVPELCMAGTSMCLPRRVQWGGEAGDNSGEEARSVFVPVCSEGAVLAVDFPQAASWLKMHKQ